MQFLLCSVPLVISSSHSQASPHLPQGIRSGDQEGLCRLWTATHCNTEESKVSRSSKKEDSRISQGSLGGDIYFRAVCPLKHQQAVAALVKTLGLLSCY